MPVSLRKLSPRFSTNALLVTASMVTVTLSVLTAFTAGGFTRTANAQAGAAASSDPILQPFSRRPNNTPEYSKDSVLIAFHERAASQVRSQAVSSLGLAIDYDHSNNYFVRAKMTRNTQAAGFRDVKSLIAHLKKDKAIRVVEPDYKVYADYTPNDEFYSLLWGLNQVNDADIDMPEAWDISLGSTAVKVAVIDTGVDYNHPDLTGNILRVGGQVVGYDFYNNDADPMDDNQHGTHCAGTIGAKGNNTMGVIGVSPNVRIIPIKFLGADGGGDTSAAILSIDFAREKGAHIMSNSWGGGGYSQLLKEAIERAKNANIIFIAAAGNSGLNTDTSPQYPAGYNSELDNVVSVGASTYSDKKAWFSNYGANSVDIFAPGYQILSTVPGGEYDFLSGTSMATPHVAGAVALIKGKYFTSTYLAVKNRLLGGVDTPSGLVGFSKTGRMNVYNALENDTVLPGVPTNVITKQRATTGLLIQWTAAGDDGAVGKAAQYDIRYSTIPITTANFASMPKAIAPRPLVSGTVQTALITGLTQDTGYYVAIRALDNVGNASSIGKTAYHKTTAATAYLNDAVSGAPLWTSTGSTPWSITSEQYVSPSSSWTDSPGTFYNDGEDKYLTLTTPLNLSSPSPDVNLSFKARTQLEFGYDYLMVEVSGNGGATWTTLGTMTGDNEWGDHTYSLAPYSGSSNVRIRFRMTTDGSITGDGVWLDDIKVTGTSSSNYFQALTDGAETSTPRKFTGPSPWATTAEAAYQGTQSYADSPGGSYMENVNLSLTQSASVALTGFIPELGFAIQHDLETGYDHLFVETSIDNGVTWQASHSFTGNSFGWLYSSTPFQALYGKSMKVRFRLYSDTIIPADGVHLDNITIGGPRLVTVPRPLAPASFVASATDSTTVALSWGDTAGADEYKVYRKLSTESAYNLLATLPRTNRTYSDITLAERIYSYRVTATNAGGESSATTAPDVKTMNLPTNLVAANGGVGTVNLTWVDATANETLYTVEYKKTSVTTWSAVNVSAGATSRALTGLASGTAYQFRVRAGNATGRSSYSSTITFTAP